MISIVTDEGVKPKAKEAPKKPRLEVVAGTEVDISEAWDSMLNRRFASEQAFGQFLLQEQLLRKNLAEELAKAVGVPQQAHQQPKDLPIWTQMGQQQQAGALLLKPKSP